MRLLALGVIFVGGSLPWAPCNSFAREVRSPTFPKELRGVFTFAISNAEKACEAAKTEVTNNGQDLDLHSDNLVNVTAKRMAQFEEICGLDGISNKSPTGSYLAQMTCENEGEEVKYPKVEVQTFGQGQGSQEIVRGLIVKYHPTDKPFVYVRCPK